LAELVAERDRALGEHGTEPAGRAAYGDQRPSLADPRKSARSQSRRRFSRRTGALAGYGRRKAVASRGRGGERAHGDSRRPGGHLLDGRWSLPCGG
jgi:hypothetical protein